MEWHEYDVIIKINALFWQNYLIELAMFEKEFDFK